MCCWCTGLESYCLALYDYEATCPEELSFTEGKVIRVLRKVVHGVDDGWWEGELDGHTGLFPSLVVEECREDGEPLTPQVICITCSLPKEYPPFTSHLNPFHFTGPMYCLDPSLKLSRGLSNGP
jgi:SH3 domain.